MNYPYTSPIILTDEIYTAYGGHTGSSVTAQRQAAYQISEMKVSEDLETYLTPTIVTGTYLYKPTDKFLILENTYINRVIQTSFVDEEEQVYWSENGTNNIYVSLRDSERGLVDIHYLLGKCNCLSHARYPYKIEIVYECGLSSGTSYQPDLLLALTTYADIILNEIIGYGNEAPGDIGVQSYANQGYSENRVKLLRTTFGTSARAQFVRKLLSVYRRERYIGLQL